MVIKKRPLNEMVDRLLEAVPLFESSEEYGRLDEDDRIELPMVVVGQFNLFLCRLQAKRVLGEVNAAEASALEESFRVIEEFSASPDTEVVNTVVVEIFEHLDLDSVALDDFKARLGKTARRLYDEWIE
jgi:hypothetical protein